MVLYTEQEYLSLLKEISMKVDFTNLYDLCLRIRPNMCQYYDEKRLYKKGELLQFNNIKHLVLKDVTEETSINSLDFFQPIQSKNLEKWLCGEYIQKDMQRISLENNQIYQATKFINQSTIDPALTTDGKWVLIQQEII